MTMTSWSEEWNQLSDRDKEQFARVVNLLFEKTFLLREVVDSRELRVHLSPDFRFLERHSHLFREYLKVSGWGLQLDDDLGVAALYHLEEHNRKHLDKNTTYFLYVLRLIYEEQMEKLSLRKEARTTVGEVLEKMFYLGLLEKKPSEQLLRRCLSYLKGINIIDKLEGAWTHLETRLVIYPSIVLLVTPDKIESLFRMVRGDQREGEEIPDFQVDFEIEEDTGGDVQDYDHDDVENIEDDLGEENIEESVEEGMDKS